METLFERLNLSDTEIKNSVKVSTLKDINVFDTLCLYCADKDIDVDNISDIDFSNVSSAIENYRDQSYKDCFYFSIDAQEY